MRKFSKCTAFALTAAMTLTLFPSPAQAAKTKISASSCVLSLGDKTDLNITGAKETGGVYTTSDKKIATVNKKGVVTAKKTGRVKITWKKGGKKLNCVVKVVKAPTLGSSKITLKEKQSKKLTVNAYGNKKLSVKWSTSNKKIASVKNNKVTGVSAGKATLKATIKGYTKTWAKKVSVTVKKADNDIYAGYNLVWEDQFDGDSLNRKDWNIETHEPGWVNEELQEYTTSSDNIYVKDGKLIIKPVKTEKDGKPYYTSGRVNTQNKHDFKYGLFEARVKVPEGKGFLPAFWMMPTDENLYGQWPRCGEIDIMEVLGDQTDTSHGTIHYGNPHAQSQGSYQLKSGSFSSEFHTFSAEWEPGKISWYVDGRLIHTESDWHSTTEGQGTITYPAPFDQPFYLILNLAVGNNWAGYPDETTDIDGATYEIDYVRAYQKDSYDENVEKPEKTVVLRDPDKNGNYVVNGDFAVAEDLTDASGWQFMTALGGEATAEIKNNELTVSTTNEGTVDYSVQLVQPNIPLKKGGKYEVSFDAYADAARTMKTGISGPDYNYVRYMADTEVELGTEKKTYTYAFTMTSDDDANARLEYNMGLAGSTAGIHISNVSIVKTGEENLQEAPKTSLADGNYVYNGSFQEGKNRLGYWEIQNRANAEASVTNADNVRKLKVVAPEGTSAEKSVVIGQKGLALIEGTNYALSFTAEGDKGTSIKVTAAGQEFTAQMDGKENAYSFKLAPGKDAKDLAFTICEAGTFYLDDVRIVEDSLIKNGSFNAGFSGYEPFVDSGIASEVTYVVDSQSEDNAADFTIKNTGDADWKIQLKQNNIELEKGQWYKFTLKAKSGIDREFMFALQHDGSADNDWMPYMQEVKKLGRDYQTYEAVFQMEHDTDLHTVLSISMGAVNGKQITEQHRICIDEITLEKTEKP